MREVYYWLLSQIVGAIIFILLGIHMIIIHLDNILGFFGVEIGEPVSWNAIMERAQNFGWAVFYFIFLALALYHGFYGLRKILVELSLSPSLIRIINRFLPLIGIILFAYGTYITISAYQ